MTDFTNILIGKGDKPVITMTLTDSDGVAVSLVGATGTFKMATKFDETAKASIAIDITDAANGVCTATLTDTHTDTAGCYVSSLTIIPSSGQTFTTRLVRDIKIQEVIA